MDSSGRTPRSVTAVLAGTLALLAGLAACSRASTDLSAPRATASATTVATSAPTSLGDDVGTVVITTPAASSPGSAQPDESGSTLPPIETVAPISVVDIDEVGTPGLDSSDAFCAAWSRFAGSFQVVAVTAAFGTGPAEELAALEVAASPVVTESYETMFANWPEELASEEAVVADQFLGPFHRRLSEARASLVTTGADEGAIEAIAAAWVEGLARRDPSTPEFTIDLPDELWSAIDTAADAFARSRVPFGSDPSLTTGVSPPLTNEYLAVACPDQGTLGGQEVDTP